MRRVHWKIVGSVVLCDCALFMLYGTLRITDRTESGGAPVSITDMKEALSIIILDAESEDTTKTQFTYSVCKNVI